jgi:hypothetical protein
VDSGNYTTGTGNPHTPNSYSNSQQSSTGYPYGATYAVQTEPQSVYQPQASQQTEGSSQYQYGTVPAIGGYNQQPLSPSPQSPYQQNFVSQSHRQIPRGQGRDIVGTYQGPETLHYEPIDHSFYVRPRSFFFEGRVFAVIMNETAGSTSRTSHAMDYTTASIASNSSISRVKYHDNLVYTNKRRFVVVRQKKEFCFACPIFTYSGRATTKPGVRAEEHGVIYSEGESPRLVQGESGISKTSIGVVMATGENNLQVASRIYYGIHHPIQYNVKVKEIGQVIKAHIPTLIGNWKEEDNKELDQKQKQSITANGDEPDHG